MSVKFSKNNDLTLYKNGAYLSIVAFIICFFLLSFLNTFPVNAATKETKKPSVTLTTNIENPTNQNVNITIVAKDTSGIKTVKWAKGSKKASYFAKKGTSLNLKKSKAVVSVIENGIYTFYVVDKAGNTKISKITISNIDRIPPTSALTYTVNNQVATITINGNDEASGIDKVTYLKGKVTDLTSDKWNTSSILVEDINTFTVKKAGNYSVMLTDKAGNKSIEIINITMEFRAMWISYLEFGSKGYTEDAFIKKIDTMFDNCVDLNMNAVVVQIRPSSDALYNSDYYPWSVYISGTQGKNPGFDPLEYMVEAAHQRGLEFHAWLNPYRVTLNTTDYTTLSEDNPARVWLEDDDESNDRNVLEFSGKLYYNPASSEAQELIVNGVKEIVENYDVDGINFDDYFYPSLGSKYKTTFDNQEYDEYVELCEETDITPFGIADWRRDNVSNLVKEVYASIKSIDSSVRFGISPAGNIDNLTNNQKYYVDITKWLSTTGYVDYIAPQIYWSFTNKVCPYAATVDRWLSIRKESSINVYISLAVYRAGSNEEPEWRNSDTVLMRQVISSRNTKSVDGFMFYRYDSFFSKVTQNEINNLLSVLK